MDSIQRIYDKYHTLTPKQKSIADYLLANPQNACYISLKKLSRETGSSEVSVLRTCAALGFDGFLDLKEAFRIYSMTPGRGLPSVAAISAGEDREATEKVSVLREICGEEMTHLQDFMSAINPDMLFEEARTLMAANEVFIFGHDVSKVFADYIFHRLTFLRIKASSILLGDSSTVQSMLARVKPGDHAIFLSFPPYHLPAITSAKFAMSRGADVTIITDSISSPAVIEGSRVFLCDTGTRYFYNSHTLIMSLVNLFASCIAIEMGREYKEILMAEQAVEGYLNAEGK